MEEEEIGNIQKEGSRDTSK